MGTFESPFTVPDLAAGNALRVSSIVLSNQRERVDEQVAGIKNKKKLLVVNPLIDDTGQKLVPNVTKVFRSGQNMFVYLEVYDPAIPATLPETFPRSRCRGESCALFRSKESLRIATGASQSI